MTSTTFRQFVNLLSSLKYAILFAGLLVGLPLTAFSWFPGHGLLGGLFLELERWHVFFAVLCFFAVAWSLMFCTGLLIDCIEKRLPGDYLSRPAREFFNVEVSGRQFALFALLGAVPTLIVVWKAVSSVEATVFAILGYTACYLVMVLLCTPARLADPSFVPLPRSRFANWFWRLLDRTLLPRLFKKIRLLVSRALCLVRVRYALEPDEEGKLVLRSDRFFAMTNFLGLVFVVLVVGWYFFPPNARENFPPAAAFLYVLLALALWVLLTLECHLAKIRLSPILAILVLMMAVWGLGNADHYYQVPQREVSPVDRLTPEDVVKASQAPENLVVVSSAGGGILAAGWTSLVLKGLIHERPELAHEIRLLSTISGGSVGAAQYTAALQSVDDVVQLSPEKRDELLSGVYLASVESSLAESTYGFAMFDFWRLFFGAWLPVIDTWDRGRLQEDAWCRTAAAGQPCSDPAALSSLIEPIRLGRIPAVIFGTTVMETGRRVMVTPMSFKGDPIEAPGRLVPRAPTLSEYLFEEEGQEADVSLWTAARLSATFAYVSPAASAQVIPSAEGSANDHPNQGHHMLDGGYYENFGVTSAVDWLNEVLEAQIAAYDSGVETLPFKFEKILLVRLNAFRWKDPLEVEPKKGSISALLGPVLGLAAIRTGVAVTRNEFDLTRFIDSWNERLASRGLGDNVLAQVEFRPGRVPTNDGKGLVQPLSWHLTQAQIAAQQQEWPEDLCAEDDPEPGSIRHAWQEMLAHLGGECPAPSSTAG